MSQQSVPAAQDDPIDDVSSEASDATLTRAAQSAVNQSDPFLLRCYQVLEDAFSGGCSAEVARSRLEDIVLEARVADALHVPGTQPYPVVGLR